MPKPAHGADPIAVLAPSGCRWARITLAGKIDSRFSALLAEIVDWLRKAPVTSVFVDVAAVTSADDTLADFCLLARASLPAGATLTVCRPTLATLWVLEESGATDLLTVRDSLPLLDLSGAARPAWSRRRRGSGSTAS
jgi:hypothetical protein